MIKREDLEKRDLVMLQGLALYEDEYDKTVEYLYLGFRIRWYYEGWIFYEYFGYGYNEEIIADIMYDTVGQCLTVIDRIIINESVIK